MEYFVIWFIMTNGTGYLPPLDVKFDSAIVKCDLPGNAVGVELNSLENPTRVKVVDPHDATKHCEVDIREKMLTLAVGEYHLAHTGMGKSYAWNEKPERYNSPDPHTSVMFIRSNAPLVLKPTNVYIKGK